MVDFRTRCLQNSARTKVLRLLLTRSTLSHLLHTIDDEYSEDGAPQSRARGRPVGREGGQDESREWTRYQGYGPLGLHSRPIGLPIGRTEL